MASKKPLAKMSDDDLVQLNQELVEERQEILERQREINELLSRREEERHVSYEPGTDAQVIGT